MRKEETSSGISPEPLTLAEEILEEVVEIMSNKPRIEGDAKTVRDRLFTIYFYFIVCVCAWGWGWGGGGGRWEKGSGMGWALQNDGTKRILNAKSTLSWCG